MLRLAGQTAGWIGLKFFVDTQGFGVVFKFFFHEQRWPLQLIVNKYKCKYSEQYYKYYDPSILVSAGA